MNINNKIKIFDDDMKYVFNDIGVESVIFYYKKYKDILLKYFRDEKINREQYLRDLADYEIPRKTLIFPKNRLENKEKKIETIKNRKSLKDEVEIISPAYYENEFKGYLMKKENLKYLNVLENKKKKIKYLKLIREKIELLNNDGIFIGDFNENNFLTNKDITILKLCDLDNLRIDNYNFDTEHIFVKKYEKTNAKKEYIDSYCFNMFTIAYLNKINLGYFVLNNQKLPRILGTKENEEILESMKNLDSSYQYKFLIDNIK
ncbi:MAG: hypothetical protein IJ105_00950 [Bacilli bacterium]|nr:hypothetical protein [Bacilli bacterium]